MGGESEQGRHVLRGSQASLVCDNPTAAARPGSEFLGGSSSNVIAN